MADQNYTKELFSKLGKFPSWIYNVGGAVIIGTLILIIYIGNNITYSEEESIPVYIEHNNNMYSGKAIIQEEKINNIYIGQGVNIKTISFKGDTNEFLGTICKIDKSINIKQQQFVIINISFPEEFKNNILDSNDNVFPVLSFLVKYKDAKFLNKIINVH